MENERNIEDVTEHPQDKHNKSVDRKYIVAKLSARKKLFYMVWGGTFVLSCLYIFPQPRYYTSKVMLAPEMSGSSALGGLGSIASSFGFDFGSETSVDAIYPDLYPDLMSSNDFVVSLFNIPVKTIDGEIETDLYTYETQYQKIAYYSVPLVWFRKTIRNLLPKKTYPTGEPEGVINPFRLDDMQNMVVDKLKSDIYCIVDSRTSVFTIYVTAQDPLVAATLADSVRVRLQSFITDYRTSKARIDLKYYEQLVQETRTEYLKAQEAYSTFCDSHQDIVLHSWTSERDRLENEMSLKYNAYTAMTTQFQAAQAKVQERMPAFTVLQNASVPIKPAGPKRLFFVATMLILATVVTVGYVLRSELMRTLIFFSSKS